MLEIITHDESVDATIRTTIRAMGPGVTRLCEDTNLVVRVLDPLENWTDVIRDYWRPQQLNNVCQGMYDPIRGMVVLRSIEPYVIAHELAHLVDFHLGEPDREKFRSDLDDSIQKAYRARRNDAYFISAYSSVNRTEFVAEGLRSAYGFGPLRPGRKSDYERLSVIDPAFMMTLSAWIEELDARFGPCDAAGELSPAPSTADSL